MERTKGPNWMWGVMMLVILGSALVLVTTGPLSSTAYAKGGANSEHGKSGGSHSVNLSGTPYGFGKGEKKGFKDGSTPPGWSKGEKKGWLDAGFSPGLEKKQPTTDTGTTTGETTTGGTTTGGETTTGGTTTA